MFFRANTRAKTGQRAEQLACHYLTAHGYVIEQTNARFPVGEIDVIARDGTTRCFVEVRSASSTEWGGAAGSITDRKRQRLIRAATWWLQRYPQSCELRFDAVLIQWQPSGPPEIELIKAAFDASK